MKLRILKQATSAIVAGLTLTAVVVFASDGLTVPYGSQASGSGPSGNCRRVTNNSPTGLSVYAPTASDAEWASFIANPPSGVSLTSCAAEYTIGSGVNVDLCAVAGYPSAPTTATFTITSGSVIGSNTTALPALSTGTCWAAGSNITLVNNGYIMGMGGNGGSANGGAGNPGGPAVSLSYALTIDNTNGYIFGGGAGGSGGGTGFFTGGHLACALGGGGGGGGQGYGTSYPGSGGPTNCNYSSVTGGSSGGYGSQAGPGSGGAPKTLYWGSGGWGGTGGTWGAASGAAGGNAISTNGHGISITGGNNGSQIRGSVQ